MKNHESPGLVAFVHSHNTGLDSHFNISYTSWKSPECLCYAPFRYIKIGDKECEFNHNFRLILHTKLANPHYKPELQAQTTLLNFTVTQDGLEAQLLAEVVSIERPDLEKLKVKIMKSPPNTYTLPSLHTLVCQTQGLEDGMRMYVNS